MELFFEIWLSGSSIHSLQERRIRHIGECPVNLLAGPDVEEPLAPCAVGIERGIKSTLGRGHLPLDKGERLADDALVERTGRQLTSLRIYFDQLGIVVEHFL